MTTQRSVPEGFVLLPSKSPFAIQAGPFYQHINGPKDKMLGAWVDEKQTNSEGFAHGGFLLTFADIALSWLSQGITVSLSTDLMRVVKGGNWIQGRVIERKRTRSLIFADLIVTCNHKEVMRASGLFKPVSFEKHNVVE